MEQIMQFISALNALVWGVPMLVMILGTGIFLMIGLQLLPLRRIIYGFCLLWQGRKTGGADGSGKGEISPFQALMTALAATIGTGNIAGVATAIFIGGPGALFWMWCTALVGMATKFAEAVCAVHFREQDVSGRYVGGPMYYIRNGLTARWHWLATTFAIFGMIAGFGIGNTVQANSVAAVLQTTFSLPHWVTGIILACTVAIVLIGGLRRIAEVASSLVPIMAVCYVAGGLLILLLNFTAIPAAIELVVTQAFSSTAATGGFAGATVWAAIQFGVARGIFSNEAGLGSAPIAHAAAVTDHPVRQGVVAMLGTFLDTIIVCSITGLVIIVTGVWSSGVTGAALSSAAFAAGLPSVGSYIVTFALVVFAFTTLLGWSYYGERCVEFLFGIKSIMPFRVLWIAAIPLGAIAQLDAIWLIADTLNALMALPNLIALLLLSPVVFKLAREYFA